MQSLIFITFMVSEKIPMFSSFCHAGLSTVGWLADLTVIMTQTHIFQVDQKLQQCSYRVISLLHGHSFKHQSTTVLHWVIFITQNITVQSVESLDQFGHRGNLKDNSAENTIYRQNASGHKLRRTHQEKTKSWNMTGVLFIEAIRYNACETPTSIVFHAASLYTWYNLYRSKSVHYMWNYLHITVETTISIVFHAASI